MFGLSFWQIATLAETVLAISKNSLESKRGPKMAFTQSLPGQKGHPKGARGGTRKPKEAQLNLKRADFESQSVAKATRLINKQFCKHIGFMHVKRLVLQCAALHRNHEETDEPPKRQNEAPRQRQEGGVDAKEGQGTPKGGQRVAKGSYATHWPYHFWVPQVSGGPF